jgi:DNA-binding response OmpR family regulator
LGGERVNPGALIVDHDQELRQIYALCLRLAGLSVDEAEEGREGLAKALSRRHDVIVMDTRLFGLDGYQLCELLRRDRSTQAVPIVIVTGESDPGAPERAFRAGATKVLVKPCPPEQLLTEVRELLQRPTNRLPPQVDLGPSSRSSVSVDDGPRNLRGIVRRQIKSRIHERRDTITPPIPPPTLVCPLCDEVLIYRRSHLGGVSERHPEQWDDYECPNGCGTFQYRQRTRKVRHLGTGTDGR